MSTRQTNGLSPGKVQRCSAARRSRARPPQTCSLQRAGDGAGGHGEAGGGASPPHPGCSPALPQPCHGARRSGCTASQAPAQAAPALAPRRRRHRWPATRGRPPLPPFRSGLSLQAKEVIVSHQVSSCADHRLYSSWLHRQPTCPSGLHTPRQQRGFSGLPPALHCALLDGPSAAELVVRLLQQCETRNG